MTACVFAVDRPHHTIHANKVAKGPVGGAGPWSESGSLCTHTDQMAALRNATAVQRERQTFNDPLGRLV